MQERILLISDNERKESGISDYSLPISKQVRIDFPMAFKHSQQSVDIILHWSTDNREQTKENISFYSALLMYGIHYQCWLLLQTALKEIKLIPRDKSTNSY